jgi:hypothetical protein
LTITGASAQTTIIDGDHTAAVVTIRSGSVNLSQVTIRNGSGLSHGGGGIYNAGVLTITKTRVSGNTSNDNVVIGGGLGGGIYNSGTLTIIQSTVSGNSVSRARMDSGAAGGGIYNAGRLTITNSTLGGNQAVDYWPAGTPYGGGLANENGTVMIYNSTVSQNAAIFHTPFGIVGANGGGIYNSTTAPTLQNSIVANNTWGGNCNGNVTSHGYNMSSDSTCNFNGSGDQRNINPRLGPLQNNGGPTQTMALLPGSPAMDAGNPSGCTDSNGHRLTIDQRGDARPISGACDMGAYNH